MKQLIITIYTILTCSIALAQSPPEDMLATLKDEQQALLKRQDSLHSALSGSRSLIGSAQGAERDSLTVSIVKLESHLFDTKAKLSKVGNELAKVESEQLFQNLEQGTSSNQNSGKIYQTPLLIEGLSKRDITTLSKVKDIESSAITALGNAMASYDSLKALKHTYDTALTQSELSDIIIKADSIKDYITELDMGVGKQWCDTYNHCLGLYIVMLDRTANVDRSKLEAIERKSREVRRSETFLQSGSLAPNLSVIPLQKDMLLSYEEAIASAVSLSGNYSTLSNSKIESVEFKDIEFLPRILYIYSDIQRVESYPLDFPSAIPEVILPEKGLYYSVQVALLSSKVTSNSMFRGAWPLQVQTTTSNKYRYIIGGFRSYSSAVEGAKELSKMGFRSPRVVGFIDGQYADNKVCQAYEKNPVNSTGYKVTLSTKSDSSAEILRTTMEMHAKGKSATRIQSGENMIFTISEFPSKDEAEVFAQILRDKTSEENINVEQITL